MADDSGQDLIQSAQKGDFAGVAAALEKGADPDSADRWGVTALAAAAQRGDLESLRTLLDKGANPDKASNFGNTALMVAAARGHDQVVADLLKAGVNPEARNKWGMGPEDWARWPENNDDILALLQQGRS